jgi:hypothetical protein
VNGWDKVGHSPDLQSDDKLVNKIVRQHIDMINGIIANPKKASLENWSKIEDHDGELEVFFFVNAISDGSEAAFSEDSLAKNKYIAHFKSNPAKEPSSVLQYLRLSLMMYNSRPGPSPYFVYKSFKRLSTYEIYANCDFVCVGSNGFPRTIKAKIFIGIDRDTTSGITLDDICVGGHSLFAWWYSEEADKNCR